MKRIKLYLTGVVFILATAGAFATRLMPPLAAEGHEPSDNACVSANTRESNCDANLTSGIQCTVLLQSQIKPAFQPSTSCATPLYRPN